MEICPRDLDATNGSDIGGRNVDATSIDFPHHHQGRKAALRRNDE